MKYLIMSLFLASCASKPQLYPNQKFKMSGKEASQKDIDKCIQEAEEYLDSSKGKQISKSAGAGAAVGAAIGAVGGLFSGNLGRGLLQGGAMGAAGGGAAGAISPDVTKRNYVDRCLSEKGYEIIGWD